MFDYYKLKKLYYLLIEFQNKPTIFYMEIIREEIRESYTVIIPKTEFDSGEYHVIRYPLRKLELRYTIQDTKKNNISPLTRTYITITTEIEKQHKQEKHRKIEAQTNFLQLTSNSPANAIQGVNKNQSAIDEFKQNTLWLIKLINKFFRFFNLSTRTNIKK